MGAKRILNVTSKSEQTHRHTNTHIWTFRLIESIGPEGRCFENTLASKSRDLMNRLSYRLKKVNISCTFALHYVLGQVNRQSWDFKTGLGSPKDGSKSKNTLKHRENRKTLPREHLLGCQGVKMFLLKDPFFFKSS